MYQSIYINYLKMRGLPFLFRDREQNKILIIEVFPIKIYTLLNAFERIVEALLLL